MNASTRILLVLLVACTLMVVATSAFYNRAIGVCIRNCAQCEKMFEPWFMGEKCADSCVKYKGKLIPDCQDEVSVNPFLQAYNQD